MFSVLFFLWLLVQSGCPSPGGVCSVCAFLRSVIAVSQITQDGVDRFLLGVAILIVGWLVFGKLKKRFVEEL